MAQAADHWPFIIKAWAHTHGTLCGICDKLIFCPFTASTATVDVLPGT